MLIYLLRHGQTEYNAQKRYQGQRDIPLSAAGIAQLRQADFAPEVVYVTPLQRTAQTARVFFPGAKLIPVDGLKEMNFGRFEGQTFVRVEQDPEYLEWVRQNEASAHPDGERKSDFCDRVCAAFAALVDKALADGEEERLIVLHLMQVAELVKDGSVHLQLVLYKPIVQNLLAALLQFAVVTAQYGSDLALCLSRGHEVYP